MTIRPAMILLAIMTAIASVIAVLVMEVANE